MSQSLWREGVKQLKPYIPGKSIEDAKKESGLDEIIRLASNENPFGPSKKAIRVLRESLASGHLYPDSTCGELRSKLSEQFGLTEDHFVVTNGADNVITLVGSAYINPGDEVIYCVPTFPAYRTVTVLMGGIPVEVPMTTSFRYDLKAITERITERTKLVFICNPNNPTGTIVTNEELDTFLENIPEHVIVVLDEAYIEFIDDKNYRNGIDYIRSCRPVISIRTFSKLYGLAGLRVGYAVASEQMLKPILAVREPFAVNRLAQDAAVASLEDEDYKRTILDANKSGMQYLYQSFTSLGYDVVQSHTNFLFVDMKCDTSIMFERLMRMGILIRPCAAWGLKNYARITIGSEEQNRKLVDALKKLSKEQ